MDTPPTDSRNYLRLELIGFIVLLVVIMVVGTASYWGTARHP